MTSASPSCRPIRSRDLPHLFNSQARKPIAPARPKPSAGAHATSVSGAAPSLRNFAELPGLNPRAPCVSVGTGAYSSAPGPIGLSDAPLVIARLAPYASLTRALTSAPTPVNWRKYCSGCGRKGRAGHKRGKFGSSCNVDTCQCGALKSAHPPGNPPGYFCKDIGSVGTV